jgi:hypothetical protein
MSGCVLSGLKCHVTRTLRQAHGEVSHIRTVCGGLHDGPGRKLLGCGPGRAGYLKGLQWAIVVRRTLGDWAERGEWQQVITSGQRGDL